MKFADLCKTLLCHLIIIWQRDLRNIKTKIKVSGCFRTTEGAENYLKIMSYIGTAKKNGINAVKALKAAFDGTPDIIFGQ